MPPFLDPSRILLSPMFAQRVTVRRRIEVINGFGEVTVIPAIYEGVVVTITSAGPNDLQRLAEDQRTGRNMCVVTRFKLRVTAPGYQPDLIYWEGDYFVIKDIDPYPKYGAGFVQAIMGSVDYQDKPVTSGAVAVGQFNFSDGRQSGFMTAA